MRGISGMTDVKMAVTSGEERLKNRILSISTPRAYNETAYHLPISYALTGIAVHDRATAQDAYARAGNNPIVAAECILSEKTAVEGKEHPPYTGFIGDTVLRKLGYSLVDGSILGLALVIGTPGSPGSAAGICRELQEKYMLTFLAGGVVPALQQTGVKLGLEYRLIPLGSTGALHRHYRPGRNDVWRGYPGRYFTPPEICCRTGKGNCDCLSRSLR
jgi:acetyl-CoA decarbonylase/synthase, CODH/ACS complex subunit beta